MVAGKASRGHGGVAVLNLLKDLFGHRLALLAVIVAAERRSDGKAGAAMQVIPP